MRSLRSLAAALILPLALVSWACAAEPRDYGRELFGYFLSKMNPEKAYFQLSRQPGEDGSVPWAYLECTNASVRGLNVEYVRMDCFDAVVTPPAEWPSREYPKVKSMLACHAEARFTEKDVNDYFASRVFGRHKEWSDFRVSMKDDHIALTAFYNADLKVFSTKVRLDLRCRVVSRGTALWLEDISISVNSRKVSMGLVRAALDRIQPFLDMSKYNLPLHLSTIDFRKGQCVVRTRILPKPLSGGMRWDYKRPHPAPGAS